MREFSYASASEQPQWQPDPRGRRLLFVQSAPAGLQAVWDFADELQRVRRALGSGVHCNVIENPTPASLSEAIARIKPDIVHLSGFDNAQGLRELRKIARPRMAVEFAVGADTLLHPLNSLLDDERGLPDGYLMSSDSGLARLVPVEELSVVLSAGGTHCAYFVGVCLANSAARTAALLVGEAAALSAIGFQDVIDDTLAEYFFELFYSRLGDTGWNLPLAFQQAWMHARREPNATRATGIALWAGSELLPPRPRREATGATARAQADLSASYASHIAAPLRFDITPVKEMNYAVLHNNGQLFERFIIERGSAKPGDAISVDVEVHLGSEKAAYSKRFGADTDRWNLTRDIHVPLTASLVRSVREAVNSSVVVQVALNDRVLCRDSHRLRLLPVDLWRDNVQDGQWLPSFVQPRDPAVVKAVEQAQRYVRVLRDDPSAGFEGYQAAPEASEDQLVAVDLQVQALWATLLHDWRLGYINPPPGYSEKLDSQRLRTPSAIYESRSGTCIDLALLFAACLELIDVYPVIFLLNGHCLPGYWRHHSYQDDYRSVRLKDGNHVLTADRERSSVSGIQRDPWQAGTGAYREIAQRIRARELVPIETVSLTEHCGFVEAIEAGVSALSVRSDFHSMLDIVTARMEMVTPLPIVGKRL